MAKLINGDGNKAIWAAQDADLIAALAGDVTGIAKVGNKYAATQEDANTIGLSDGVIVTKEGRRIQLDTGNVDLFDIPTGTTGVTNYYIIGYHLFTNSDSSQECETFVQKMDNGTDVIVENTFKGGATEVYVSLYRITQAGLNISSIDALLSELDNISALKSDLSQKAKINDSSTTSETETWSAKKIHSVTKILTKTITKTADSLGCFNLDITSKAEILLVADTSEAYTYYIPFWYANANTMAVRGIRFSDGAASTGSHTVKVWYRLIS